MATSPHMSESASPMLVWDLLTAFHRTAALNAAIELDMFRVIGEGAGDVASIARGCNASERGIRILCDNLTILGVLRRKEPHTATLRRVPCSSIRARRRASRPHTGSFRRLLCTTHTCGWRMLFEMATQRYRGRELSSRRTRFGWNLHAAWRR